MALIPCHLSHPVRVVISRDILSKASQEFPGLIPALPLQVEADFKARLKLGAPTPTLLVEEGDRGPQITFCTPKYEVACRLTGQRDAYWAYRVLPLSIRSRNQLARGAVGVSPKDWQILEDVSDINRQARGRMETFQSGYAQIQAAWETARRKSVPAESSTKAPAKASAKASAKAPPDAAAKATAVDAGAEGNRLTAAEQSFLADMETLIDLARQVELDRAAQRERVVVSGVEPVARPGLAGTRPNLPGSKYRFRLAGPSDLAVGDFVWAGTGRPGERGRGYSGVVVEVGAKAQEKAVLVRFYQAADSAVLARVEWLIPWASAKQYDIQDDAVKALKEGQSLNPSLLKVIVNGLFEPYDARVMKDGSGNLNAAQLTLVERALQVPDLLLALGPPGTGKTHTIREIVAREIDSKRGDALPGHKKRVLITSKNNRAVDNVLEGLHNIDALRIGREEAVSPEVRPLMIDNKAQVLQQKILRGIAPRLESMERWQEAWPQIQQMEDQQMRLAVELRREQGRLDSFRETLFAWQRDCYKQVEGVIDRQVRHQQVVYARALRAARQAEALQRRIDWANQAGHLPLIGSFFVLWSAHLYELWQAAFEDYRQARKDLLNTEKAIRQVWEAYRQHAAAGSEALRLKQPVEAVAAGLSRLIEQADRLTAQISEMAGKFEGIPAVFQRAAPEEIVGNSQRMAAWNQGMTDRRALLRDWQELLQTRPQALYPTLIQTADVVGATCIGVATDARFDDLEFDLAIADEAGQIQAMDLLVPLVRARRAVLVGDHQQLPPLADDEVERRAAREDEDLRTWLKVSLFEQLFARSSTPQTHKVMLDTQYRMPKAIADFISHHFYNDNYHTGAVRPGADPFFPGAPMVFIDTLREPNRWEKSHRQAGEDGEGGYSNELEARMIATLALAYADKAIEWGVIVPYKKQAERIRVELQRRRSAFTADELSESVATVDSFQGKERDVIIYGFTRSNVSGSVGFLVELRRLNVSLTRARRQLILVGDSGTLTRASDRDLAGLVQSLIQTIRGTIRGYLYASDLRERFRA